MSATIQEVLKLIDSASTGVLATVSDGKPFTSLTGFAFDEKQGALIFLLSGLARHTKNLKSSLAVSFLIESERRIGEHPLDKPRVTVSGQIRQIVEPGDLKNCESLFLERNPESKMLVQMKDFGFFLLEPEEVYFVKGFGSVARFTSLRS